MTNNSNENFLLDDANSPDVNRKVLGQISEDFIKVADNLRETSYQIRKRGFSDHPVFVVTKQTVDLGSLLFDHQELGNQYIYRASYLDEFIQRNLVGVESIELFKENYKNPDEYACLFVLQGDFTGFVFVPFPED